jgi:hypothetical protein
MLLKSKGFNEMVWVSGDREEKYLLLTPELCNTRISEMPCQPRAFRSKCQGNKTVILKDHVCK